MALSSRYPQLLCILMRFFAETGRVTSVRIARIMLNDVATSTFFINSKPRFGLSGGSQSPLSGADASCPQDDGARQQNRRGRRLEAEVL